MGYEQLSLIAGLIWLVFSISSGWAKKRSWSISLQTIGFVFAVLQAYYAGINGLAILLIFNIVRNIIFYQADKYVWARNKWWSIGFIGGSTILYLVLTPITSIFLLIPLVARVLGIMGYANLDNYKAKQWHLSALTLWIIYYASVGLYPSMIGDFIKGVVMAISLPRTKRYRDEMLEKGQDGSI